MPEKQIIPENAIHACVLPGLTEKVEDWIRPCQPPRQWMDDVPKRYIYRCIPMVAANTMGWELLNPVKTEILWNGGDKQTDVQTSSKQQNRFGASSHFGSGVVTWYLPFLFRTPPELGLVVTGPANHQHDNAVPLDAFIRTDWLPFPFTMNWRLTKQNTTVTFHENDPICRIFPFPISMLENTQLEIHKLETDPVFLQEVNSWGQKRQENVTKQQADAKVWLETGEDPTGEGVWNSQYVKAKSQSPSDGFAKHQTIFKCSPAEDKRRLD